MLCNQQKIVSLPAVSTFTSIFHNKRLRFCACFAAAASCHKVVVLRETTDQLGKAGPCWSFADPQKIPRLIFYLSRNIAY